MSISKQEWTIEQDRVTQVTQKISGRMEQLEGEVGNTRTEVVDIRKHFWDEVTVNYSSSDDVIETFASMKQQAEVLSERERSHRNSTEMLRKLKRLVHSPYFGRIDFVEDGYSEVESIYLGISSFFDEETDEFLIYDWRAPVSSLYYDYPPGRAVYDTPNGEVQGILSLKRQYGITDGSIRFMFDTGVTIGDELLQQVLSRSANTQMKSIVATIQKEQNQIIRNDRSRLLIVQGAAGSGKTSAALQRVAYLLYKYRDTLAANQMVLFSPNPLFNSYVSTVLPELGEENMQQTTLQDYFAYRLGKEFQLDDSFDQLEYVLTDRTEANYAGRMCAIRYKSSVAFLETIYSYKDLLEQEGMIFNPIQFQGRTIISAEQMYKTFYSYDSAVRLANRVVLIQKWLYEQLDAFAEQERQAEWVEEEMNYLEPEDYQRAYAQVRRGEKGKVTFDHHDKEHDILARMIIDRRLRSARKIIKELRFVNIHALYRQLYANPSMLERITGGQKPEQWTDICKNTLEKLDASILLYEDTTPYLYLKELVQGFHSNTSVRHVFVDEVQDYSPFQLEYLKRLFPRAKMTVLGDLNQAIYAHASALHEYDPLLKLYGPEQTEIIRLLRSYRSTKEIVQFTRGMIGRGDEIIPFERIGEIPNVTVMSDRDQVLEQIVSDIETFHKQGYESIAVICKTKGESEEVFQALQKRVPVRLISKTTLQFEKGTLVIPSYLAKGVEFDVVIIYDASDAQYGHEDERKLFYTACTRAMHRLHIYALGKLTCFITSLDPETSPYQLQTNS